MNHADSALSDAAHSLAAKLAREKKMLQSGRAAGKKHPAVVAVPMSPALAEQSLTREHDPDSGTGRTLHQLLRASQKRDTCPHCPGHVSHP